jgi:parallel beta-helix repeat protein
MNAAAQGAIQIANTATLVAAQGDFPDSRPANTGEFISIYATGLGPVLTQPATGVPPASPSDTVTTPIVTIGDVPAVVTFSGAVPGFLGLYVVNVQVPSNTPTGPMVPLVLSMAGAAANAVGIAIASPLAPIYVSSCQTLTGPGTYVLTTDLSSTDAPCLVVGGANVQLDCAGHKATTQAAASVSAVSVSGVSGLGVRNCTIRANSTTNVTLAYPGLAINGSNQVFVAGNDIQWVNVSGSSSSLWFESNHITVSLYTFGASGLVVQGNIIENPGRVDEGAMISLGGGSGNQILNNSIDGGWDHGADQTGTDDGIFLSDDTGDTVVGNIIQNVYDAGIEALGSLRNSLIGDNVIQYAENNGIASYYGTTWSSNIVRYNQVSLSPTCVFIEYIGKEVVDGTVINLRPSNEYEFHDNSFVNNVFRNGVGLSTQFSIEVVFPTDLPSDLANNLIMGNDLGPGSSPPALAPAAAFVDGGGNICGAGLSPVIKCTSP